MNKYQGFERLDKTLNKLILELAELHRECIMDGKASEAQVNMYLEEIEYTLEDSVNYNFHKIRTLL